MEVTRPAGGLYERYLTARAELDGMFDTVDPSALFERPIPERHRIAFYLGHVEAFDWNLFQSVSGKLDSVRPEFDRLFAFGIDPVDGGLPDDRPEDWPVIASIRSYCAGVRERMDDWLPRFAAEQPDVVETAIEHRLMHAETLAYMIHQLPSASKLRPVRAGTLGTAGPFVPAAADVPEGEVWMGRTRGDGFGWDNEYGGHCTVVPGFRIDSYMTTNGQFLEFAGDGGYERPELWDAAGWNWARRAQIEHPAFWIPAGKEWRYRTMFDEIPLPLDWPVYTSHAEASAYARWAGKQLPTEAQWQRAAFGEARDPAPPAGNFDFKSWDPVPVHAAGQSAGPFGACGMVGNGWEWTRSPFAPFPGFAPCSYYPGYSADFFDGRHFVMKGASARTAACMARPSFRNWFQPHYQYVYCGFRCAGETA